MCVCVCGERERLTCSFDRSGLGFLGGVMVKIGSSPVTSTSKILINNIIKSRSLKLTVSERKINTW